MKRILKDSATFGKEIAQQTRSILMGPTAKGPPVIQHHKTCGHDFHGVLHCSECGEVLSPFDTEPRVGDNFPELAGRAPQLTRSR